MPDYDLIYIDDESTLTMIFEQIIKLRYRHWRACAFVDALELYDQIVAGEIRARAWIIDLMLPGKSGIELAQAIRQSGDDSAVLLAYTALDMQTLSRSREFEEHSHLFERVVGKQEGLLKLLSTIDATILRRSSPETRTAGAVEHSP